ncbi:MAG: hypothetical protein JSU92_14165 [Deltaproteobacteria bacterium]|nr:MAG: hypothetical protein JSU92_14165 [Deltaproteobacteria bacterium]
MQEFSLLLNPTITSFKNRVQAQTKPQRLRVYFLVLLGLAFWVGIFIIFYRILVYFQSTEYVGDILIKKLLSMIFLTFFSFLVFSNIITAFSTYFLSDDLNLIVASPVSLSSIYFSRFVETVINSSWMVLGFGLPVFLAYGVVHNSSIFYYIYLILLLFLFLLIPAGLGIILTMFLVQVFPARRTQDVLFLLSIFFIAAIYLLFRFLQPEKLVDPESFNSLMEYFAALRTPDSTFLPSYWATESLFPVLRGESGDSIFYFLLIFSSGLASMVVGNWVSNWIYYSGWTKAQEAKKARITQMGFFDRTVNFITSPFHSSFKAIMSKDIKTFFRDTTQWSQLLLLGALVVVYLYNFSVLPLDRSPIPSFFLQNIFSFLNLGLAGFVLSALAVRFVFPAVSLEGKAYWLVKTSPISTHRMLWSKFWTSLLPILVLSEFLIILSNTFLKVTDFMMILTTVTIFFMSFGIVGLGVGIGAIYPRFQAENVAKIATGFGGIVYMIICMGFIGAVVILEANPVYIIFMAQLRKMAIPPLKWTWIIFSFCLAISLNIMAFYLPMKLGIKKLETMEV